MKIRTNNGRLAVLPLVAAALAVSAFNGQCASPVYPAVVKGDGALGYYRFNDSLTRTRINVNSGSLGASGNATNDLATFTGGVVYSMPGAIVGDPDRAAFYDFTTRTEIPFNSALNPPNTQPFSVEAWIYAVSDQAGNGMGVLANRLKPSDSANRQGWVVFQRGLDANHSPGQGMGWDFQMYDDLSTSTRLQVKSSVPITLGKWQHLVVVYDAVQVSNATLTIFIDGVQVNQSTWTGGPDGVTPGYGPATGDHSLASSPHGQPAMSLGGYNNANPEEPYGFANPWTGGIDEFAWYSNKLSPAQILAHYQNATNAARSTPYDALVKADNPVVYLRLNEVAPGLDTDFNVGDQRSAGHATNTAAVKHPGAGALAGRPDDGSYSGHLRNTTAGGHVLADIPWTAGNNPDASVPFTIEGWFRPTSDYVKDGPSAINNRYVHSGARTGWIIYLRDPNSSYTGSPSSGGEGVGWNFRMYTGTGSGGQDVKSSVPYNVGEWTHLVVTWNPQSDVGPAGNGGIAWKGIQTMYVNGVPVATNGDITTPGTGATYSANTNPTDDASPPADFAVGAYNLASGLKEEFEGDIDEIAFYKSSILTDAQILAHYQAGTNSHPATNYETLVFNAAGDSFLADPNNAGLPIPERSSLPQTYLRFNGPAFFPAANSGSLGYLADGSLVLTTNIGAGPITTGFENPNPSVPVDGTSSYASLNNPLGLKISGQITLEAWVKPSSTQGAIANIIAHGPTTPTVVDPTVVTLTGSLLNSNEVFLRIEGSGATYSVGTSDGTTFHGATAAVTAGDLGGANGWIHLAGTYDGSNWRLFRNGTQIGSAASAVGALSVPDAEWAIGSAGMGWTNSYSGGVDEAAIYGTALSPATIAAHYYVGQNGPVSLTITHSGSNVTINWPAGTLQQKSTIGGTWTDVGGASAPSFTTAIGSGAFYRVKL
jgi:hypothetical protein